MAEQGRDPLLHRPQGLKNRQSPVQNMHSQPLFLQLGDYGAGQQVDGIHEKYAGRLVFQTQGKIHECRRQGHLWMQGAPGDIDAAEQ